MIAIKRMLENLTDIKAVNNVFVDFYLDGLKKRRQHKESKWMVIFNYFTVLCQVVCLVKYAVGLAIPLSDDIKLITYDVSKFFGGIEAYNRISFISLTIGIIVAIIVLRVKDKKCSTEWTQVFEITRNKVLLRLMLRNGYNDILVKLILVMNLLYKLLTIVIPFAGECISRLL